MKRFSMKPGGPIVPFSDYILKVHSRCNLACDYCYMYEHADQSWRNRPLVMSEPTVVATVRRIRDHVENHKLQRVSVGMHGGEPLLAGHDLIEGLAVRLRGSLRGICDPELWIQTNGALLDERFCEIFLTQGIEVGVSLDGGREANDRHRLHANGRSSFSAAVNGISLLTSERYRPIFSGLLCTIDTENDPIDVYESLAEFDPPAIDLLLPHANWENPPPRHDGQATQYADWLIHIFDRWNSDHRPFPIRLFDSIIDTSLGGSSGVEAIGIGAAEMVVVETDGTLEQVDHLKSTFEGAAYTGLDVLDNSFDEAAAHPGIRARQTGESGLAAECQACPLVASCGGGLYSHRYQADSGFDNPSVYCTDLYKLIQHIRVAVDADMQVTPSSSMSRKPITSSILRQLGQGYGDRSAVDALKNSQRSLGRLLVASVYHAVPADPHARQAWLALTRIDQSTPAGLAAVLAHPYVRVRATNFLARAAAHRKGDARTTGSGLRSLQRELLVVLAAAAGARSGLATALPLTIERGGLYLPTLGVARLVLGEQRAEATLTSSSGSTTIRAGDGSELVLETGSGGATAVRNDGIHWQPTRSRTVHGVTIALVDDDPYRNVYGEDPSLPLSDAAAARWWELLEEALRIVRSDFPVYWDGVAGILTAITPLRPRADGAQVSGTSRDAFGAVGVAATDDPETLALLLLHEIQHAKLGALMDVVDLHDEQDSHLYPAAWREDLRPLEGLLQGTYAHIAVADFWRNRSHCSPEGSGHVADREYRRWRDATDQGIDTLVGSGSLTDIGLEVALQMRSTVHGWT
ncbi:FxsB family cyclophane-forming radical SAM/SPASM peptide maturase [Streptacidiphilus sp. N1-12]|uniref:FxsB family cyclophane-forming radical SAM/SPASM peptide maturase n=2 Tax=Streptacidiphilus alkalitolerans TaxID=3342712 RepID=A0ABV6VJQ2_9ACTN